jgi:hypothetical protein
MSGIEPVCMALFPGLSGLGFRAGQDELGFTLKILELQKSDYDFGCF